ncbi:hypothetical protein HD554DRAFT_2202398 [Boletus coccyginus]|nr:hypothetical protein HD554DRAFT_2202398 [Boletus coccyginus]
MKPFTVVSVLGAVASALSQTIEIGTPTDGTVLSPGQTFTAQILRPNSIIGCIEVGIALAINPCSNGVCPQPSNQLGSGGFYQNFTVQIPDYTTPGPAIFTLTHLCLIGAGPYPLLEFRNASVTIE